VPKRFRGARNMVLLIFSLIFYASNEPKNILIMLASIMLNYVFGLLVERTSRKKLVVFLSVVLNLSILIYFKYTNFLCDNISAITGIDINIQKIIMPVGISFFTFQAMSYVFDIYFGSTKAQKNPLNVILYISLFPQLVAGPIVRYETIAEEISSRDENERDIADGIAGFIIGFAKKIIIANEMGVIADLAFGEPKLDMLYAWVGIVAYTFQIYFDFSAYSDMAIGLGKIFGFHFPQNFNYPYIAQSITDFWRRWHISLSVWFRDYVYIPLGGNRCSRLKHLRNIMTVWLLTGIWHGASWNFVVWGLYYGIILIIEKNFLMGILNKAPRILRHIYTMLIVLVGFVFFRADNLTAAWEYLKVMFGGGVIYSADSNAMHLLTNNSAMLIIALIGSMPIIRLFDGVKYRQALRFGYCMFIFLVSIMYLTSSTFNPFIYFRF
jgi:alginate O-acetyltransferase complex protein AlgI